MAEDFQAGNWWKASGGARSNDFDGSPAAASISSSAVLTDVRVGSAGGSFNWSASNEIAGANRPRDCEDLAAGAANLVDSGLQLSSFGLSNPSMDWSQTLLMNTGRGGDQSSFQAMLQQPQELDPVVEPPRIPFKNMNQPFLLESGECSSSGNISGFQLASSSPSSSYRCSSPMLQGLFDPADQTRSQQSLFDNQQMELKYSYQTQSNMGYRSVSSEMQGEEYSWDYKVFPQELFKGLSPKQAQNITAMNQLQFTNNTPFWNASTAAANELLSTRPRIYASAASSSPFDPISSGSSSSSGINVVKSSEGAREKKLGSGEPALKKPRLESAPPPLPTFKVRKEKLGDRITALQQLVSPFGKTDTASVLHEAIEYIKFLHDQVSVLSTPYLKNGHPMQQQQKMSSDKSNDGEGPKLDLRSRGLCLVPIASTYPVASETSADFWTPTSFGAGAYR
ncbi:Transcription factor bHLH112 [Apostasia shenzhenica]|uniref:Transcription factor bHLH112 n=1 Tax=Apostasia shenzhenica TaxID=1088818 RepID=A0A2H9ZQV3_9ASPA|nr:Transcription factor bHLH112 [Apostasia shenzhenica]